VSTHSIGVLHALTQVEPRGCRAVVLRKPPEVVVDCVVLSLGELEDLLEGALTLGGSPGSWGYEGRYHCRPRVRTRGRRP